MIRNNRLLNEENKGNQTTHDLELENNGTGSKQSTRAKPLASRDALL